MAEITWEKRQVGTERRGVSADRWKFIVGGVLMLAAVVYLIVAGTGAGARYFITIDDLLSNPEYIGQTVRITGAVDGDTIVYDTQNLIIDFTVANMPSSTEDLAQTLHYAVNDPNARRLSIHIENQVKPDLLQHEAQAILTGSLGTDGTFYATELLLKCPSRYEESVPAQAEGV
ncbi:MAG: cytochrome c maturation protein CcmE [Anaerolineae bacterium]|nr:cytochrome c maturation protein CcmE [Anaerolineae bacterium]